MSNGLQRARGNTIVNARSRNWCFTLNNPSAEEKGNLIGLARKAKFLGYGNEVAATGTPHLQGVVCFNDAKTLQSVKSLIPRAHIEKMLGTCKQAWEYCKKDGDFVTYGALPLDSKEVGEINRQRYLKFISEAKSNEEPSDPILYVQYYNTFKRIRFDYGEKPVDLEGCCGIWIYGLPGSGKSHSVSIKYPKCYRKMSNKWWDGYDKEEVVWLDDLDPDSSSWISRYLKIWADKWTFPAEIKGGKINIRPKKFIVTSNYQIKDFGFRNEDEIAIKRRFIVIEKSRDQEIII